MPEQVWVLKSQDLSDPRGTKSKSRYELRALAKKVSQWAVKHRREVTGVFRLHRSGSGGFDLRAGLLEQRGHDETLVHPLWFRLRSWNVLNATYSIKL